MIIEFEVDDVDHERSQLQYTVDGAAIADALEDRPGEA
jgi:hypothetical protein